MAIGGIKGITIKIGGDTKELTQALQDAKNQAKLTTREMQEINKALIANPKDASLHAQQQANYREQLNQTKGVMEALTQADVVMKQRLADGEIDTKTYEAWRREIHATEGELKNLAKRLDENGAAMVEFGKKVEKVGKKMQDFGKSWSMYVTAPLMAGAAFATKAAMDYETAFVGIRKTTDMTEEGFRQLDEGIREMSNTLPATQVEIANLAEAAGRMNIGENTDEILEFTKVIVDMGAATDLAGEQAADTMGQFAKVSGMAVDDFSRLGSAVVELGNNGLVTESQIMTMAQRIVATGSLVGMAEADIVGLSAALGNVGIGAESGGTSISKFLMIMQLAVAEGGDKLREFARVSNMTVDDFKQTFEEDATEAVLAFISGLGTLEGGSEEAAIALRDLGLNQDRMRTSLLALAEAHEDTEATVRLANQGWAENSALLEEANLFYDTAANKLKVAQNQIREAAIAIGQQLIPMLVPLVQNLAELVNKFTDLDPGMQKFILGTLGIVAAIGPALVGTGMLLRAIGDISKAMGAFSQAASSGTGIAATLMKLGPTGLAVAGAVAGLAIVAAGIYTIATATTEAEKNIEEFNEKVAKIGGEQVAGGDHLIAQAAAVEDLVGKIEELNTVEDLSATQKGELRTAVEQLMSVFPELNLEIDETTGKIEELDLSLQELVDNQIRRQADLLRQKALSEYTDAYITSVNQRMDAEDEYEQAREKALKHSKHLTDLDLDILRKHATGQSLTREEQLAEEKSARIVWSVLHQNQIDELYDLARAVDDQADLEIAAKARIQDAYTEHERLLIELGLVVEEVNDDIGDADNDTTTVIEKNTDSWLEALRKRSAAVRDVKDAYEELKTVEGQYNTEGVIDINDPFQRKLLGKGHYDPEEVARDERRRNLERIARETELFEERRQEYQKLEEKANQEAQKAEEQHQRDLQKQRDQWASTLLADQRKWQDYERRAEQENLKNKEKYHQELQKQAEQWQSTLANDQRKWADFERRANEENLRVDERYNQALANQRKQWEDTLKGDQRKWQEFERTANEQNLKNNEKYQQDLAKQRQQWQDTLKGDQRKWHEFEERARQENAKNEERYQQDLAKRAEQWSRTLYNDKRKWHEFEERARQENLRNEERYQQQLATKADQWAKTLYNDTRKWWEFEQRAKEQNLRAQEKYLDDVAKKEKQWQDTLKKDRERWLEFEQRARDQNLDAERKYQEALQKQRQGWADALKKDQRTWLEYEIRAEEQNARIREQHQAALERQEKQRQDALKRDQKRWRQYETRAQNENIKNEDRYQKDLQKQRDEWAKALEKDQKRWLDIQNRAQDQNVKNQEQYATDVENATQRHLNAMASTYQSGANIQEISAENQFRVMARQLDSYRSYLAELETLEGRVGTEMFEQLKSEGVSAYNLIKQYNQMSLPELEKHEDLYVEMYQVARDLALKETKEIPEITAEGLLEQEGLYRDAEGYLRNIADDTYLSMVEAALEHLERLPEVTAESLAAQDELWRDAQGYLRDSADNAYATLPESAQENLKMAELVTAESLAKQAWLYRDSEGYLRDIIDHTYRSVSDSIQAEVIRAENITAEHLARQNGLYRDNQGYLRKVVDDTYANLPESALEAVKAAEVVTATTIATQAGVWRDSSGYLRDAYDDTYANLPESALEAVKRAETVTATSIAAQAGVYRDSAGYLRDAYDGTYANLPDSALEAVTRAETVTATSIAAQAGVYRDNAGYLRDAYDGTYANLPDSALEAVTKAETVTATSIARQRGLYRDNAGYLRDAYDHTYANLPDSALEAVLKAEYTNAESIARQQGLYRDSAGYLRNAYDGTYANLPASALENVTMAEKVTADSLLRQQGMYRDADGYFRYLADDAYVNVPDFAQQHLTKATTITAEEMAKQYGLVKDQWGRVHKVNLDNWNREIADMERRGLITRETAARLMGWVLVELDKPVTPKGEQVGEGMHDGMLNKKTLVRSGAKILQKEVEKGFKPDTNKMITDMIGGLNKGVERNKKRITGVGEKFAVELAGGYNKYLEISSPSRFFERSIGYMADGAERGEVKNRKRFGEIAEDIAEPFRQIEGVTSGEVEVSSNLALRGIFDYGEMAQALSHAMDDVRVNLDSTSVGRVMYRGQQQALRG